MMSMAKGVRLGVMCSTKKRRRNSNYYDDDDGDYESSRLLKRGNQAKKRLKMENDDDDDNLLNKKSVTRAIRSFRLRKCSSTPIKKQQVDEGEEQMDKVDEKEGPSKREKRQLENGDKVNLSKILFTKNRDFLITYNDRGRPVHAKHLEGKFIVLHFVPLLPWTARLRLWITSLAEVYAAIHPKGCFEVVFIGVKVDASVSNPQELLNSSLEDLFEEKFSIMPWTAIPFSDIKSPEYMERRLGFPVSKYIDKFTTASFVIDPTGMVLQCLADIHFLLYGAPVFPFSDEKIDCLISQDEQLLKHPNITKLLSSPGCDYVINKEKQEVPVHNLEDKVVAFYFYENFPIDDATEYIQKAYEQVADKEKFEVVLVYVHNAFGTCGRASEESFWESFNKMPWLALPFKDPRCSTLQRIFNYPKVNDSSDPDQRLVIIGPQGKFFDPYGLEILKVHGPKAYPFTRQRIAELAAKFVKKVTLDKFWNPNTYFEQNDGSKIKMSQLVGKRIILIFDDNTQDWATLHPKFLRRLKARYLRMKGTDDEFEVISIISNDKAPVPWLRHPPFGEKSKKVKLLMRIFKQADGLLAFDGDGRVVRSTTYPTIERGNKVFPFYAGGLEKEFLEVIVDRFEQGNYNWFLHGYRWE